jgi:hypothetical protein
MKKTVWTILTLLLPLAGFAGGVQTDFGSGTTGAPWVKLPNNARTAAMGEVQAGLPSDVNALTQNPAWLSGLGGQQFAFMHNSWIQSTAIEHAAYGLKVKEGSGAAVSLDYVNMGSIDKFDVSSGVPVAAGSFTPTALNAGLGWGQSFGNGLSGGVGGKYLSQNLDGNSASSMAADLGLAWKQEGESGASAGVAVQNLGGQIAGSSLPLAERFGAGYHYVMPQNEFSGAAEVAVFNADSQALAISVGGEYWYDGTAALRAGYKSVNRGGLPGLNGLSLGAGARIRGLQVDYAFTTLGELGNGNLISLVANF